MRKFGIPAAALALVLAFAAVAMAVTNTYTVTGGVLPTKSGTKKKPVPVEVKFNYTVGETNDERPSAVKKYSILFDGLIANTNAFKKCSAASLNSAGNDDGCPAGSRVGGGNVEAVVGPQNDTKAKALKCNLKLDVYNGGNNKLALFLNGSPNSTNPAEKCVTEQHKAIDASLVRKTRGTALEFVVPEELLFQLGLDIAVVRVKSNIKKMTATVKGRKVGFFETTGGCRSGKRNITVTFTPKSGPTGTAQTRVKCS